MDHHVYFWLKEEYQTVEYRQQFEQGLQALFAIPQVRSGRHAKPAEITVRPVHDQSWTYAITMVFDDVAALDIYQVCPEHEAFLEQFRSWWQKVLVMDLA